MHNCIHSLAHGCSIPLAPKSAVINHGYAMRAAATALYIYSFFSMYVLVCNYMLEIKVDTTQTPSTVKASLAWTGPVHVFLVVDL